jgi:hypothetical protein
MARGFAGVGIALALLAAIGCDGAAQDPEATGGDTVAFLPAGCRPIEVRDLLTGFARSIEESNRTAVASYVSSLPELVRFSLYVEGRPAIPPAAERRPLAIAERLTRLLGGRDLRLLGAQIGSNGPLAGDTRYDVPRGSTAGADLVFASGRRSLAGKVGIDCDTGRLYLAALSLQRGMHATRLCGQPITLGREEPLVCAYAPQRSPRPYDSLLTANRSGVVHGDCRRAAWQMNGAAVYCPPLIPRGPVVSQNRSSRGRVSVPASGDAYTLNFVSDSIAGVDVRQQRSFRTHLGHWLVSAASPAGLAFRRLTTGYGARVVDRRSLVSVPVVVVERRANVPAIDAGHVTVAWRLRGRAFAISLHGFEHRSTAIKMAQALIAAQG